MSSVRRTRLAWALALTLGCVPQGGVRPDGAGEGQADCRGFGGKLHGVSTCARLDRSTGAVTPIDDRVTPQEAAAQLRCDRSAMVNAIELKLECESERAGDARRAKIFVVVGGDDRRVLLDEHRGNWDFINVWVAANDRALDFTIDYGV